MNTATSLLNVEQLCVWFDAGRRKGKVKAVDGVSFEMHPGETLGVVGESGCGKSTLARAILRLIPPTSGDVFFGGQRLSAVAQPQLRKLRQRMQIVFQDPLASLDPRMTIGEIIAEPLRTFHPQLTKTERVSRVKKMMDEVGLLAQMINRYPHEFSGGQCQRVGIARAMISDPELLICDEPVSALDVSIQAQIITLLKSLQQEHGLAILFISHDLSVVRHISHQVMVLYLGRVMELADREPLFERPAHPYSEALISAAPLPDPHIERHRQRVVLHGDLPSPLSVPDGCVFHTRCPKAQPTCRQRIPMLERLHVNQFVACHYPN